MPCDLDELSGATSRPVDAPILKASPVKRAMDIALALAGLLAAAPILAVAGILIKLESKGPILFRQRRTGRNKEEFLVYKLRSMRVMEDGAVFRQASRNDPRVTRVGAFVRRTSIDELPQLLNVLKGDMSMVGPRPHPVALDEIYSGIIPCYDERFALRPGITGLAQVSGARGETRTTECMAKRIDHDLAYIRHWSHGLDMKIMLRTLLVPFDKSAF